MIADAATAKLREDDDLDWKESVDEIKDAKEFAKDVAAMANTAGGLIVFGVREDGADHAEEIVGIVNPQPHVQSMRAKASMIRPFVPALRIYAVPLTQRPGKHLIVVEVPKSPEAPHLVPQSKESWGLPRRRGSDTDWLGESDLEAAYAGRFRRRREAADYLDALADQVAGPGGRLESTTQSIWLTVAASCSVPSAVDAHDVVDGSTQEPSLIAAHGLLPEGNLLWHKFDGVTSRPRIGLRRSVISADWPYRGKSKKAHLELLHDGSFTGALDLGYTDAVGGRRYLPQRSLEQAIQALLTLAALHADRRKADGILQVRADIPVVLGGGQPIALTHQMHVIGEPEPVPSSIAAQRIVPVTGEAPLADVVSLEHIRSQLIQQLSLDLVHQFSVATLTGL